VSRRSHSHHCEQQSRSRDVQLPEVIERYFRCLEAGDFDSAALCFAEAACYSHPPYADDPPGAPRHEATGREAILALFRRRGLRTTSHQFTTWSCHSDRCFVSGVILDEGETVVGSFVSEIGFADDGRIGEYVAYSSRPAVWHAE
jgi:ketosteroid isomerase-like protein